MTHRVAVFMGTRPEAIKMAPVIAQLSASEHLEPLVINSGQHREMIQQVIDLFGVSVDHELNRTADRQHAFAVSRRSKSAAGESIGRFVLRSDRGIATGAAGGEHL